jgi:2-dehydro-3-deoxyphosphogluconate aldolase / (4S)-4-hydroxy-2-oxoglutarate aldolase
MVMPFSLAELTQLSPVIPVVAFKELRHAVPAAKALLAGGLRIIEVTLRTDVSLSCLEAIAREAPEMVVGAGTVRQASEVARVKAAGARFVVSPGFSSAVNEACKAQDLPLLPGVSTATEAMAAHDAGHTFLKLFPAEAVGGVKLLKALHGPFPDLRFCPTGGITAQNASDYLALPNVVCVGGSWLVSDAALAAENYAAITQAAREACALRR